VRGQRLLAGAGAAALLLLGAGCTTQTATTSVNPLLTSAALTQDNETDLGQVSASSYAPPGEEEDANDAAAAIEEETATWPRLVDPARGLVAQTERVDVACLKPELVTILADIEAHFGAKPVITSGFRAPRRKGRRASLHTRCEAADIQVPGVQPKALLAYLREHPTAGGIGTYCHTRSVHVDVGSRREWSWGCGRRGRRYFALR